MEKELKGGQVHAPIGPKFEAIKNKATGELRCSTVDLALARDEVKSITKIDTYGDACSDHYPVAITLKLSEERANRPRRITKTLLQSYSLAETAKTYYDLSLRKTEEQLENIEAKA